MPDSRTVIYEIEFAKSARKEFLKLPRDIRLRVSRSLDKLAQDPKSGSVRPMVGTTSWRLRVGDYRVIYDIHDKKLVIVILRTAHRRKVYKNN